MFSSRLGSYIVWLSGLGRRISFGRRLACRECFLFSCALNAISLGRNGPRNTTVGYTALHSFHSHSVCGHRDRTQTPEILLQINKILVHSSRSGTAPRGPASHELDCAAQIKSIYIGIGPVASRRPPDFRMSNLHK